MSLLAAPETPRSETLPASRRRGTDGGADGVRGDGRRRRRAAPSQGKTAGGDAGEPRAEAQKLRGAIEARRRQSADLLLRMQKVEPVLKAKVAAASGAERKTLAEKQALLAKEISEPRGRSPRAEADLEAIDSPGSKREELLAILARQKADGKVAEIHRDQLAPVSTPTRRARSTRTSPPRPRPTPTARRRPRRCARSRRSASTASPRRNRSEKAVTDGTTTARAAEEKKTNVSLAGKVSIEDKKTVEVERGRRQQGRPRDQEVTGDQHQGRVADADRHPTDELDGSSVSETAKQGVERGDGDVVAHHRAPASRRRTSRARRAPPTRARAAAWSPARTATGAKGAVDGGKSVTTKKGRQAEVVVKLHANVTCKIGEPKRRAQALPGDGDRELRRLGGGLRRRRQAGGLQGLGQRRGQGQRRAHHGRDPPLERGRAGRLHESAGGGVEGRQGGGDPSTRVRHHRHRRARRAGTSPGEMWQAGGKTIGEEDDRQADPHRRLGARCRETKTGGIAAKGNVGPVGGGYGVTDTKSKSSKATRNATGGLDVDNKQEKGRQTDKSISMQAGVVALEVGHTQVHKTRFGYSISIEPKNDPDGKILEALGRCDSRAATTRSFIRRPRRQGQGASAGRKGKTDAEGTHIAVSVGGAKLKLGTNQSVDTDDDHRRHRQGRQQEDRRRRRRRRRVPRLRRFGRRPGRWPRPTARATRTLTLTSTKKQNYGSRVSEKKQQGVREAHRRRQVGRPQARGGRRGRRQRRRGRDRAEAGQRGPPAHRPGRRQQHAVMAGRDPARPGEERLGEGGPGDRPRRGQRRAWWPTPWPSSSAPTARSGSKTVRLIDSRRLPADRRQGVRVPRQPARHPRRLRPGDRRRAWRRR